MPTETKETRRQNKNGVQTRAQFWKKHGLFFFSAEHGDVGGILQALAKGVDINTQLPGSGATALMYASLRGQKEIVKTLLLKGAKVNERSIEYGVTALMYASQSSGSVEIIKMLIDNGAEVNATSKLGETALMMASEKGFLEGVKLLINRGADVNRVDNLRKTAFSLAKTADVRALLLKEMAKTTKNYRSVAKGSENTLLLDTIKDNDIMVNFPRNDSKTEYNYGAYYKNSNSVRGLKINPVSRRTLKNTNFRFYKARLVGGVQTRSESELINQKLLLGARNRKMKDVQEALEKGADVNYAVAGKGFTILMIASAYSTKEIIKLLIEKGARVNERTTEQGFTALMYASESRESLEVVKLLIDSGAEVNATSNSGETALMWVATRGLLDVAQLLIDRGADVNIATDRGETALTQAEANMEMRALLLKEIAKTTTNYRNIPKGSENSLLFDAIEENELMANFPRNNSKTEYNYGSYYKNSNSVRSLKKNPQTRRNLKNTNFSFYKARLVNKE